MTDPSAPVASPCNNICRLDAGQVCVGCGRTLHEIAEWGAAAEQRRRQIVSAASLRLASLRQARPPALQ